MGLVTTRRLTSSDDYQRLHMHRLVCDLDSVRDQADGEPQRVAGAAQNTFTLPPESAIIRGVESVSDTRKGYS